MAGRGQLNKLYRSFNKGLITEAGFLNYPEDASTDELNTVLLKGGNRTRRLGMDYEDVNVSITFNGAVDDNSITTEYLWKSPDNVGALNFLVVQVNNWLHFFDMSVTPLASGKKTFAVDLLDFRAVGATVDQVAKERVQMAGGKGYLFVASQYIDPFTIEYHSETDTIESVRIFILMRDFDGVNDSLPNDAEPTTLTKEHHYNLKNQGWVTPGTPSVQTSLPTEANDDDPATPPVDTGGTPTSAVYYDPRTGRPQKPWVDFEEVGP